MKYFRYMWVGPSLDDSRKELFRKMRFNRLAKETYLLCIPKTTEYLMDIWPGDIVKQRYFRKSDQIVVGAAGSYDEAQELAGSILSTVFAKNGDFDVARYLREALKEAGS